MNDEILKRDQNHITVLGAITDDSDQDIVMVRVDPITKRLLIAADMSGVAVTSLNGLTGAITLTAGTDITLGVVGNTITINSTANPMTTLGDIIYGGASGVATRLAGNSTTTPLFLFSADGAAPSWQPIPISGIYTYYWTPTASDVAGDYKSTQTPYSPITTFTTAGATDGQLLRTYVTEPNVPSRTFLIEGQYSCHIHARKTSGTKNTELRAEIWEVSSTGVDIAKIADLGPSTDLDGTVSEYFIADSVSQYDLASSTSRIATKIYAVITGGGSAPTIEISTGGSADTRTNIPAPNVDASSFVPYTGATANVNLGAYSLTATGITNSSMTAGSVLFAGTAGLMSQDNANFFWDDTNNRLGIGTASPGTTLHIVSTAPSSSTHPNRAGLLISSEGTNVGGRIATQVASSTEIPYFFGLRSRGTLASPTAVQNGDGLIGYSCNPHDGTEYVAGNKSPLIIYNATENWSATNHGSKIRFYTVENATTTQAERMVIDHNGYVGIGTTSPTAVLHLKAGTATANTAPLKFTSGTNLTSAEAGAMEWDGTNLYITQTTGPTRKTLAYTDLYTFSTGLTNTANTITNNLSTGRLGGQSAYGGTGAGESLTISSTLNASKGFIYLGTALNSYFDEPNDSLYIRGWIDTATDYKFAGQPFANFDGANTLSVGLNGTSYQINSTTQKMTMRDSRFQFDMGADVVSATNTTLGLDGNVFNITGTTTIDLIESANWQEGSQVVLKLDDGLRLSNNVAPSGSMASIITASGANAIIPADGLVMLVYSKGAWREPMTTYALTADTALTATTATTATNVSVSDSGADTTTWVMLAGSQTGDQGVLTDGGLTYNANTNALTATTFIGALNGNADTVTWANEASDTTCFIGFATAASGSLAPKTNTNMTFNSSTGVATFASTVLTTTDINGGTIDGTSIGATSASTIIGTTIQANTGFVPDADDGAYLGTSALGFSDLFLASGGVINWANGNATLTHSTGALAFSAVPVTAPVIGNLASTSTSITFDNTYYGKRFYWSPTGTATATLPANGATAGSWFEVYLLTNQTITISAATADTLITFNDTTADSVAFSSANSKVGGLLRFESNGTVWIAVNLSNNTMTVGT